MAINFNTNNFLLPKVEPTKEDLNRFCFDNAAGRLKYGMKIRDKKYASAQREQLLKTLGNDAAVLSQLYSSDQNGFKTYCIFFDLDFQKLFNQNNKENNYQVIKR